MTEERILVTVKTYPTLDPDYDETVCTAGFREDGSWVRIYPIPFRKLDYKSRYSKYQWIKLNLKRNRSDPRPESFKPVNYEKIGLGNRIGTERAWARRKEIVLKKIYTNISRLIEEAKDKNVCTSLAVFKPKKILDFKIEKDRRDWDPKKLAFLKAKAAQANLFAKSDNPFEVVAKVPYKFSYEFVDDQNTRSTLMIIDWEIGQLYWNCLKRNRNDETKTCKDVKKKYFDDFAKTKDLFLFLGTTRLHHFQGPNPFIIVGTFHPPKVHQEELF